MQFRVLGPLEAVRDGEVVDLGPRKQREVLSLLLMNAGRVVTTERILESVWGDEATAKENALWVTISRLRAALDPDRGSAGDSVLVTRDHGYVLDVDVDSLDVSRFRALAAEGRQLLEAEPSEATVRLDEALELWRGDVWTDVRYHDFAQAEINALEELRLAATEDLYDARLRLGEADGLVAGLEALAQTHPLAERPVRLLMLALYRSGRQAEALRAFSAFEARLGAEMGLEPSPELRRLEEQVLLHDRSAQAPGSVIASGGNPFRGLQPFREEDAGFFFGRDRLTADLVRRIGDGETLLTLVGASGSGKSSVVRAGVVPAIRKAAIEGSDGWVVATMVPGVHPLTELEAALIRASLESPASLGEQLRDPDAGFLRAALRVLPDDHSRLVLVVDQFEELFTISDERQRDRFLEGVLAATADHRGRVVVILTLRADFYDRPLQHATFAARFGDGVVNVPPLLPDELEDAATKPAELVGATIEPALLGVLLSDVLGRPGRLPLFQFVLTDLFDRQDGHLTLEAYRELGGIGGALSLRAEEMYAGFDERAQAACRQLFLRLVSVADGAEWSRRRLHADELRSMGIPAEMLQAVLGGLIGARLLTTDRDPTTGRPTIEVAHEALMSEWARLTGWIEDAQDDLRRHARLSVAVREWQEADQDPGYLWTGTRLDHYRDWAKTATLDLTVDEELFLARSAAVQDVQEEQVAAVERRTRRRGWWLVAAVVGLVGVVLWAAWPLLFPPMHVLMINAPAGSVAAQFDAGLVEAERRFPITTEQISTITDARDQVLEALARGPDLVIVTLDPNAVHLDWHAVTAAHPDTRFLDISDGILDRPGPGEPGGDRWRGIDWANHEGAFLAGAVAAERSASGSVGFLSAHPGALSDFKSGFEAGVRHTDPTVEVVSIASSYHPNVWVDEAAVTEGAQRLLDEGADVLFHAHGDGGRAALETAARAGAWGIGVDSDEYLYLRSAGDLRTAERVLTSVVKRFDLAVVLAIELELAAEEGDLVMDVSNGGYVLAESGGHLTAAEVERWEGLRDQISSGTIDVPADGAAPFTIAVESDSMLDVTLRDDACDVEPPSELRRSETLLVRITNTSERKGWFAIGPTRAGLDPAVIGATPAGEWLFSDPEFMRPPGYTGGGIAFTWTGVAAGSVDTLPVEVYHLGSWLAGCRVDPPTDAGDPFTAHTLLEALPPRP